MCFLVHATTGPGNMRRFRRQIQKSLARAMYANGITCIHCTSPVHFSFVPFSMTDRQITEPWGYAHQPWLQTPPRQLHGLCGYHRLLNRVSSSTANVDRSQQVVRGRDIDKKRLLHGEIIQNISGGVCMTCGRKPDPHFPSVGFDLNHKRFRREGGEKDRAISYFWKDWGVHGSLSIKQATLNRDGLEMSFDEAKPRMLHEATLCDVQCRSCHDAITDDQNSRCYSWRCIREWFHRHISKGIVREICGSKTLKILL